jgi:hypothetical protein
VEMCWVKLGKVKVVVIEEEAAEGMVIEVEANEVDEAAEDEIDIVERSGLKESSFRSFNTIK